MLVKVSECLDLFLFVYVGLRGYNVTGPHLNWTDSIFITCMHKKQWFKTWGFNLIIIYLIVQCIGGW